MNSILCCATVCVYSNVHETHKLRAVARSMNEMTKIYVHISKQTMPLLVRLNKKCPKSFKVSGAHIERGKNGRNQSMYRMWHWFGWAKQQSMNLYSLTAIVWPANNESTLINALLIVNNWQFAFRQHQVAICDARSWEKFIHHLVGCLNEFNYTHIVCWMAYCHYFVSSCFFVLIQLNWMRQMNCGLKVN